MALRNTFEPRHEISNNVVCATTNGPDQPAYSHVLLCVHYSFANHLDGEKRAGCFALFVFLVSHDCCAALPRGAMGMSAVCDCGIS